MEGIVQRTPVPAIDDRRFEGIVFLKYSHAFVRCPDLPERLEGPVQGKVAIVGCGKMAGGHFNQIGDQFVSHRRRQKQKLVPIFRDVEDQPVHDPLVLGLAPGVMPFAGQGHILLAAFHAVRSSSHLVVLKSLDQQADFHAPKVAMRRKTGLRGHVVVLTQRVDPGDSQSLFFEDHA